jgi:hypothetical protein
MGLPGLAGLGLELSGFARSGRNANQMIAGRTLNLPTREFVFALQMLIAVGAGKFEITHIVGFACM